MVIFVVIITPSIKQVSASAVELGQGPSVGSKPDFHQQKGILMFKAKAILNCIDA